MFEAARRSRACAYLADDDHGPLALQEILLDGCPTVGVRTGASFVRDGVTGFVVERLPPGRSCVENEMDQTVLAFYLDAVAEPKICTATPSDLQLSRRSDRLPSSKL